MQNLEANQTQNTNHQQFTISGSPAPQKKSHNNLIILMVTLSSLSILVVIISSKFLFQKKSVQSVSNSETSVKQQALSTPIAAPQNNAVSGNFPFEINQEMLWGLDFNKMIINTSNNTSTSVKPDTFWLIDKKSHSIVDLSALISLESLVADSPAYKNAALDYPSLSPNGNQIIFKLTGSAYIDKQYSAVNKLLLLDLTSNKFKIISIVPSSFYGWATDTQILYYDNNRLMLFDLENSESKVIFPELVKTSRPDVDFFSRSLKQKIRSTNNDIYFETIEVVGAGNYEIANRSIYVYSRSNEKVEVVFPPSTTIAPFFYPVLDNKLVFTEIGNKEANEHFGKVRDLNTKQDKILFRYKKGQTDSYTIYPTVPIVEIQQPDRYGIIVEGDNINMHKAIIYDGNDTIVNQFDLSNDPLDALIPGPVSATRLSVFSPKTYLLKDGNFLYAYSDNNQASGVMLITKDGKKNQIIKNTARGVFIVH